MNAATVQHRKATLVDGTNLDHHSAGVDMNNWKLPENLRWSFQHMADFLPTATISRGMGRRRSFRRHTATWTPSCWRRPSPGKCP